MMEQRSSGVSEQRAVFKKCLDEVFLEVSELAYHSKPLSETIISKAVSCQREFFSSTKGTQNILEKQVTNLVQAEYERQVRFFAAIKGLISKMANLKIELISPKKSINNTRWDFCIVHGCNLRYKNYSLFAAPLFPARTNSYAALTQETPAAHILYLNKDLVLLRPSDQELDSEFASEFQKVADVQDIKDKFPSSPIAFKCTNFLEVDCKEDPASLMKSYSVDSVVKVDISNFSAFIFTGNEKGFDLLFKIWEW